MILKAGSKVYRVRDVDPYDDEKPHTWEIESREVKSASDKMIILKTAFPGVYRSRFQPNALGLLFFATPEEALTTFARRAREEIASCARRIGESERAISWALKRAMEITEKRKT